MKERVFKEWRGKSVCMVGQVNDVVTRLREVK